MRGEKWKGSTRRALAVLAMRPAAAVVRWRRSLRALSFADREARLMNRDSAPAQRCATAAVFAEESHLADRLSGRDADQFAHCSKGRILTVRQYDHTASSSRSRSAASGIFRQARAAALAHAPGGH
jgi:hypothetical protein